MRTDNMEEAKRKREADNLDYSRTDKRQDSDILECIAPEWSQALAATAFTTTRAGGVSLPPYDSYNLGLHVNDDELAVKENRRQLIQRFSLPSQPVWLRQTHSTRVVEVGVNRSESTDADGSFTCEPEVVLAVLTADCLPVVIRDVNCTQLAVVHAGWRGLAGGILTEAIRKFSQASQLHAWLGPAIGPEKFEVGDDVYRAFVDRSTSNSKHFHDGVRTGKYLADLYALAKDELYTLGCVCVTRAEACTHSQNELFFSHRRDGATSGRMATVAWLSR